ncbi:MAG: glycosyltransferase [Lachnospiraceae bacterium]|nr:glycosyltransferase [Lachnospiraceae bacterium]
MKLSVIIPTYNCEEYIRHGIESVLGQLRDDCERILMVTISHSWIVMI